MTETSKLGLPLLEPAQAQKHVTVNEALLRLDALNQITLTGVGTVAAPTNPSEGETYSVGSGASGAWSGKDGNLAVFSNNGWVFVTPLHGWRAWDVGNGVSLTFDGVGWVEGAGAVSPNGAGFVHRTMEIDHSVGSGASSTVSAALPADSIVYGVTGRVLSAIGGATSFEIGVSGSTNRYGSGFGVSVGSWTRGITGSPLSYYSATDLLLTASGGYFDGSGTMRLAIHYAELTIPRA